ncbi:MAG: hypothetical protein QOH21_26 [Acidobacteriota bacterium]|nr:hypothetical protein [Acidobacteriota bacterium]
MRTRQPQDRRCSYVVLVEHAAADADALRDLARYLSTVAVTDCDVVILDASPRLQFELNARVLRWVGRHMAIRGDMRTASGTVDLLRAAAAAAGCEKVIVAAEDVRYDPVAIEQLCQLLDLHEVVEPQDYLDPLPWWGSIEAGRMLVHRGIEPEPDHGATFGFRRSALRSLRGLAVLEASDDPVRRLVAHGAELHPATDVFVRRDPPAFSDWLDSRPRYACDDFALPMKSAFFFALVPLLVLLATLGGLRLAASYAGAIAFASVALALRGRIGAGAFFPLWACLFAPLWVVERSVSVYWALYRKLRGTDVAAARVAVPDRASGTKVASGE